MLPTILRRIVSRVTTNPATCALNALIIALTLTAVTAWAAPMATLKADEKAHSALLDRIQRIETGTVKNPAGSVGDGGRAVGWMQLHRDFYEDARAECPELPKDYIKAARDRATSRLAVCAYWRKHGATTDHERVLLFHYGPDKAKWQGDRHGYVKKAGIE